jgi:hypothetical protein
MANLIVWDDAGKKFFENGVDRGVLFPMKTDGSYDAGVAWNGLVSVTESPSGAEPNAQYADNIKYAELMSTEEFGGTIEAFTYPDEFGVCDGSVEATDGVMLGQQGRRKFAMVYRTRIGNDVSEELGYKLHFVYGALASPSEKNYETVNDSPEGMTFSWEFTTTPIAVTGQKPCSHIVVDSRTADATKLAALEAMIYGVAAPEAAAAIPLPDALITMMTPG